MKRIPLTRGKVALVDDEDFELINRWKWRTQAGVNSFYAVREVSRNGRRTNVLMHRVILKCDRATQVDHINHDGLDNRRRNLRKASNTENHWNQIKRSHRNGLPTKSFYKGVVFCLTTNLWRARIQAHGKQNCLGRFDDEKTAAKAYNAAAVRLHGRFAYLNQI